MPQDKETALPDAMPANEDTMLSPASTVDASEHQKVAQDLETAKRQITMLAGALEISLRDNEQLKADLEKTEAARENMHIESNTDSLTKIGNRKLLDEKLPDIITKARQNNEPLACLIADADGLKRANSKHGFRMGDQLITAIAESLRAAGTSTDLVVRLGGDDFCMLLQGLRPKEGFTMEDVFDEISTIIDTTLAEKIDELGLNGETHAGASVGFAVLDEVPGDTASGLLARANEAMKIKKEENKQKLEEQGVVFDENDDRIIKSVELAE